MKWNRMKTKSFSTGLMAILTLFLGWSALAGEPQDVTGTGGRKEYVKVRLEEGCFACEVPKGWMDIRDKREDHRVRVYGMFFVLKGSHAGVPPHVRVDYYAPDNAYFPSADHYIKRQYEPPLLKSPDKKISDIEETIVNGSKARRFVRDKFAYWPPHSMKTKETAVREEHTVLTAREGFFLIEYDSPQDEFALYRSDYQHILDTFRPFPVEVQAGTGERSGTWDDNMDQPGFPKTEKECRTECRPKYRTCREECKKTDDADPCDYKCLSNLNKCIADCESWKLRPLKN
jgi:hypothetical protein